MGAIMKARRQAKRKLEAALEDQGHGERLKPKDLVKGGTPEERRKARDATRAQMKTEQKGSVVEDSKIFSTKGGGLRGQIAERAKAGKDLVRGGTPEQRQVVRARAREAVSGNKGFGLGQYAVQSGALTQANNQRGYTQAAVEASKVKGKGFDAIKGGTPEERRRLRAAQKFGKNAAKYINAGKK